MGVGAAPVADARGGLQMLSRGRIDLLLGDEGVLEPVPKANGFAGKVRRLAKPLVPFAYRHALAEERAAIAPTVAASARRCEKELTALLRR